MSRRTNRHGGRSRGYTPEQRAERASADAELFAEATADMADPELVARRMRTALSGMSARILGYSLRNQMLLMAQAEQRGIPLRDVDTFKGWQQRGRQVRRGEHGLRIVRPVGLDDPDPDNERDRDRDGEGDDAARVRFRFMTVFDISQTGQVPEADDDETGCPACGAAPGAPCLPGCGCPGCTGELDPDEAAEPGEVAWNRLQEQITAAGYTFCWPAQAGDLHGAKVRVAHDTRSVHVDMWATAGDPDAITALAVALAEIITRGERERADCAAAVPAIQAAPTS